MSRRIWSDSQKAVFEDVATGTGHTMISAVAGSGKTTTILESMRYVPHGLRILFVAFNKSIVAELKERVKCSPCEGTGRIDHGSRERLDYSETCTDCCGVGSIADVEVSTLHALGMRACTRALRRPTIDDQKIRKIVEKLVPSARFSNRDREWANLLVKTVSLCKSYLARTDEEMIDVIDNQMLSPSYGFTPESRRAFLRDVRSAINTSLDDETCIDFDDMIFLPFALDLAVLQYDRVFVDETQDLNAAQIELVLKTVKPGGRVCAVGDPRQAIYQFRGASHDSFERVQKALEAKVLPLSVSYRCAKAIVREAKHLVPHIEPGPDAPEGLVVTTTEATMLRDAQVGDFVISRSNAPLLPICLHFLKTGRPAMIQGKDIGTKIAALAKRAESPDVATMLAYVDRWATIETKRLLEAGKEPDSITDVAECLHVLSEGETETANVVAKIERLFADGDDKTKVMLTSTHKAKGMERDRVWLLRSTFTKKRTPEELNLLYVAITRAQRELYFVVEPKKV